MELVYDVVESAASPAVIKVIGIGGGGSSGEIEACHPFGIG